VFIGKWINEGETVATADAHTARIATSDVYERIPGGFAVLHIALFDEEAVGAVSGQALVTRIGLRSVALGGIILVAAACLVPTQVSGGGSYFADLFLGLQLFGTGLGATFVASQIAGLSGVAEQESGLAAGLVDSSFNVGSALGTRCCRPSPSRAPTTCSPAPTQQPRRPSPRPRAFRPRSWPRLGSRCSAPSSHWCCYGQTTRPRIRPPQRPARSRPARGVRAGCRRSRAARL
jgi:hypothetical protein